MSKELFILIAIILTLTIGIILFIVIRRKKIRVKRKSNYEGNQIYVGNLPYRINEYDLRNYFSQYGEIKQARIVKNPKTGRSKGYAFIDFIEAQYAQKALSAHGREIKGRSMVVRIAKPPRQYREF